MITLQDWPMQYLFHILLIVKFPMTQTKNDKISGPPVRKLFEGKIFVFVSTLMKNATPKITSTWVDLEEQNGGYILVNPAMDMMIWGEPFEVYNRIISSEPCKFV